MQKILFTLMFSTVVFTGFQAPVAGYGDALDPRDRMGQLPKPNFTNMSTNRQPEWVPQAPISQQKRPQLYQYWLDKTENDPNVKKVGNIFWVYK